MTAISIKELTGKHVLIVCFAFFGVMLAVNSLFVFYALSTFNGGEGGRAYQRGLDYNQTIAEARAQDALGWSYWIEAGIAGQIAIVLKDKGGAPVTGLVLSGEIARPVSEKFTRALTFREAKPGTYAADVGPLNAGSWIASFTALRSAEAKDIVYRGKERLWLKPNS